MEEHIKLENQEEVVLGHLQQIIQELQVQPILVVVEAVLVVELVGLLVLQVVQE